MNTSTSLSGFLLLLLMSSASAQSYELSDHSLPGSSVQTYHVKCQGGEFGLIRQTTDAQHNTQLCLDMQTNANLLSCLPLNQRKPSDVRSQLASGSYLGGCSGCIYQH